MDSRDWNEVFGEASAYLLANGSSGWIHGMGIKFLITVSAFLLMNGGLPNTGWIHGIERRFLVQ